MTTEALRDRATARQTEGGSRGGRLRELDIASVILSMLVVLIHVLSAAISTLERSSAALALVYFPWRFANFAVPAFIFIAGVKSSLPRGGQRSYGRYMLGRLTRVFAPYAVMTVVFYAYYLARGYFEPSAAQLGLYILRGDLVAHFYFVILIMQFYLLRPLWSFMTRRVPPAAGILAALIVTQICSQYMPQIVSWLSGGYEMRYNTTLATSFLVFWVAGMYAGADWGAFSAGLYRARRFVAVSFAFFAALAVGSNYLVYAHSAPLTFLPLAQSGFCLFGIAALLLLCERIKYAADGFLEGRFFGALSSSAYIIYLSHPLVIFLLEDLLRLCGVTRVGISTFIKLVAVYPVTAAVCMGYTYLKRKIVQIIKRKKRAAIDMNAK